MGVKRIAVARRVSEDTHNAAARFPAYCQRVKERQKDAVPGAGLRKSLPGNMWRSEP